jgi:lysophospholipid acyltransferase (LPLAT)-like uncharacterized protein
MKIRHPRLIKAIGFAGALVLRGLIKSIQHHAWSSDPQRLPARGRPSQRYIYATWHENVLLPVYLFIRVRVSLLVSQHTDGRLISEVCRHLGIACVHGSATRGGIGALRGLIRASRTGHLGMTPDGPRGPRRQIKSGLIYLAAKTGLPILPAGFGFQRAWRLRSWDRLAIPWPFSRTTCVLGEPISIPEITNRDQLEHYRQLVQDAMVEANQAAERWARTGTREGLPTARLALHEEKPWVLRFRRCCSEEFDGHRAA